VLARLADLDAAAHRYFRTAGHTAAAESAVRAFSLLGSHAAIWIALGLAGGALDRARRRRWRRGAAVVAGAQLLNTAVKVAVRRPRPDPPDLPPLVATPTQLSFPSAHATSSYAAVQVYRPLVGEASGLHALAAALALSRLYLGVHYPSDVLAGVALGTAIGALAAR
jgi:undecaprenyl-diphosphatase